MDMQYFSLRDLIQNGEMLRKQCSGENKRAGWPQLRMTVFPEGLPFLICFSVFFTVWKAFYDFPRSVSLYIKFSFPIPCSLNSFFPIFFSQIIPHENDILRCKKQTNKYYEWLEIVLLQLYAAYTACLRSLHAIYLAYFRYRKYHSMIVLTIWFTGCLGFGF